MLTVSEFLKYMNIQTPISQELENFIKDCILASVDEMNLFTNRSLVEMNPSHDMTIIITEKTEYYDGFGSNIIYTKNYPVVEINPDSRNALQYLKEENSWENIIQPPDTIADSVLVLDFGKIRLLKYYKFPKGIKNIKITYKSGYSSVTLPADLKRICYEKSGLKFFNSAFGNFQRLGIDYADISDNRTKFTDLNNRHEETLKRYRRVEI